MPTFFLNGVFSSDEDQAPRISALDAGFQHGVGLFETLLGGVRPGADGRAWALHLDEHLARLSESAKRLGLSTQLRTEPLAEAVLETIRRSGLERARVRLTISGGDLNMLAREPRKPSSPQDPTILIVAQPATSYPPAMIQRGVAAAIADTRANPLDPFSGHKTLNYWWRLRELQLAGSRQSAEALVFSVANHLVGGCVSNCLIVKNDELLTPIARGEEEQVAKEAGAGGEPRPGGPQGAGPLLPSPVLPGTTRQWALNAAAGLGIVCKRRMLAIRDVLEADEIFLTNSSWGVLPVVKVEAETIGTGEPGRVAQDLVAAWTREIEETAARA